MRGVIINALEARGYKRIGQGCSWGKQGAKGYYVATLRNRNTEVGMTLYAKKGDMQPIKAGAYKRSLAGALADLNA